MRVPRPKAAECVRARLSPKWSGNDYERRVVYSDWPESCAFGDNSDFEQRTLGDQFGDAVDSD
jgi:hypothetical protein